METMLAKGVARWRTRTWEGEPEASYTQLLRLAFQRAASSGRSKANFVNKAALGTVDRTSVVSQ